MPVAKRCQAYPDGMDLCTGLKDLTKDLSGCTCKSGFKLNNKGTKEAPEFQCLPCNDLNCHDCGDVNTTGVNVCKACKSTYTVGSDGTCIKCGYLCSKCDKSGEICSMCQTGSVLRQG